MKRTLEGRTKICEPVLREALKAIMAHRSAQDGGASPEEVERLRRLAESLYHTVADYQISKGGAISESIH